MPPWQKGLFGRGGLGHPNIYFGEELAEETPYGTKYFGVRIQKRFEAKGFGIEQCKDLAPTRFIEGSKKNSACFIVF